MLSNTAQPLLLAWVLELPSSASSIAIVSTAAALAALAAWAWIVWRRRVAREWNSPRGLFLELCRAHKMSMTDRWLLRLMAETQGLEQPGLLFVESERFRAAESCPRLDARAREIERIHRFLFPVMKQANDKASA